MDVVLVTQNISKCSSENIPSIQSYMSATNIYGITLVSVGAIAVFTTLVTYLDTLKFLMKNSSSRVKAYSAFVTTTNIYGITLVSVGAIAVFTTLVTYLDTLKFLMKNSSSRVKAYSAFVTSVYPVISVATFFVILVPRAHLLAEALTQGMFMVGMYQLWCLFVGYCGGEAELVEKVKPGILMLKVAPCCCWPCCICLPTLNVNKRNLRFLRILVLQLPIVQGFVYLVLLVMWAERESLYQVNYMYLQPIIIISILLGIWGMLMTINFLKIVLEKEFLLNQKFSVLQLVLIFAKLQGLITRILVWTNMLPCKPPITPAAYGNLIHNSLMLSEMVLLGFISRKLYKSEVPTNDLKLKEIKTIGRVTDFTLQKFDKSFAQSIGQTNEAADLKDS